jgi:ATP-binding cassette subfamily F protein uup
MALINLFEVQLAFGGPQLLDGVGFRVQSGERVCLLGRNGVGKSSLLGLLAGQVKHDSGEVSRQVGLSTGYLPQDVPAGISGEVYEVAAQALGEMGQSLIKLHQGRVDGGSLEMGGDQKIWDMDRSLRTVLTRLDLDAKARVETLSGGQKRRVLLARALAAGPDLLLLDEPTNHLDIVSIEWLEEFLLGFSGSMVFVSHDRAFARRLATRVVELDRGDIYDWNCPYDEFVKRREQALELETEQRAKFDKKMAQEEEWLGRGLKARRTRNEGRVRRLMEMREKRAKRRDVLGSASMKLHNAGISGKVVAKAEAISFAYDETPVIRDFSGIILRGDKVGVIGSNGSGKTTLIKLLLGRLSPQTGRIKLGANLEPAYFDQMRAELDSEASVRDNLAGGHDTLMVNGRPRHVISYLKDFLFSPDRAASPVRILSGGERNRLLLAKLFAKPANLLVLDEPTNDLDRDTLELLENLLVEFEGTVLIVSHDRQFLNNVATSTLAVEGGGVVQEYAGGYDDYLKQCRSPSEPARARSKPPGAKPKKPRKENRGPRLGFNEKRELAALPQKIEILETEQSELHEKVADPELYAKGGKQAADISRRLEELEAELEAAYARWEELESLIQ